HVVLLVLLASTAACAARAGNYPYADEPDPRAGEYVIGASDELDIQVWRNPELSTQIRVRPDGNITLPLVGDLRAAGLTPSRLKKQISDRLSAYLKDEEPVV